jgi:hypothetical protein
MTEIVGLIDVALRPSGHRAARLALQSASAGAMQLTVIEGAFFPGKGAGFRSLADA